MKRRLVDEVWDEEGHDNILECSYFLLSGYLDWWMCLDELQFRWLERNVIKKEK